MVGLAHMSGEAIRRCAVIVFDVPTDMSHLGGYKHDINRPNKGVWAQRRLISNSSSSMISITAL